MLRLAVLLCTSGEPARGKVAALYKQSPSEPGTREAMQTLAVGLLQNVAGALASGLGVGMEELLRFADAASSQFELETADAILRRLDRRWGGMPLLSLQARDEVWLRWPGPLPGRMIALAGPVEVDKITAENHAFRVLHPDAGLHMGRGALVLLRRPLLEVILETIVGADLALTEVFAAACETTISVVTPVGPLAFHFVKHAVELNHRYIRLSAREAAALGVLLRRPGQLTERRELNQALGFDDERALDRVMLHLRNKFGDGLVTTVYGAGYILETSRNHRGS